jgi:hypothetical protein
MATQYAFGKIVTNGLVLALDAADRNSYPGSGTTWRDLSGNNNSGSLINGPTFSSANGGSIVFDGVDDYILTSVINLNSFGFTMNMWFKFQTSSGISFLLDFQGTTPDNRVSIYISTDNRLILDDRDGPIVPGGDISAILSNSAISPNVWINLTATTNRSLGAGNEDNFFINGIPIASSYVFSDNLNTAYISNPVYIGNVSGSGFPYKGDIATTQIYNRALSASEILQNYNAQKSRFNL